MANKEIARDLGIAETTVKSHVRHILAKLGVCSRTQGGTVHDAGTGVARRTPCGDVATTRHQARATGFSGWRAV